MLIDDVTVIFTAGKGGDGAVSFRTSEGNPKGGPDGGNGGNGGDVYLIGVDDIGALQKFQYTKEIKADDGVPGKRKNLFGKNADDLVVTVPLGTLVTNLKTNKSFEIIDTTTKHQIARGGVGGRGNNEFKSAVHQTPRFAERGKPGEEVILHLTLRLIADIGLIGLPNAGKSSLLAVLTNAHPKIGNYPFTTIEPNLGVLKAEHGEKHIVLADIPGLIEGASSGKGLGIKFLKHIEKTKILLHCIDTSSESIDHDYDVVRKEFAEYNQELLEKKEIIVLTKTDLVKAEKIDEVKQKMQSKGEVVTVSVYDDTSIEELREFLLKKIS